jgi:hypothetical protein
MVTRCLIVSVVLVLWAWTCSGDAPPLSPVFGEPYPETPFYSPTPTPDTIRYDDGTGAAYYNISDWYYAVRFTPIVGCTLRGASVSNYTASSDSCTLFVWADAGGEPGTLLHDPVTYLGLSFSFRQVDLDSGVYVDSDFWMGYYAPGPPYCLMDAAPSTPIRSFYSASLTTWTEINAGDLLLRALVDYGDVVIHNVGVKSLRASGGYFMRNPTTSIPSAIIENIGDSTEYNFPVECVVVDTTYMSSVVYVDTQYVSQVDPGLLDTVQFAPWTPGADGEYILLATALLSGDMVADNDFRYLETQLCSPPTAALTYDDDEFDGSFTGVPDNAWATEFRPPWYPCLVESVMVYFGMSGNPAIIWVMDDDGPWHLPGTVWYAETTSVSSSGWHTFDTYMKAPVFDAGVFYVVYWYKSGAPSLGYDSDPPIASQTWRFTGSWVKDNSNDWLMRAYVSLVEEHDGAVVALLSPADTVITDSTYDVGAMLANLGNLPETLNAFCTIDGYADTVVMPDVGYGATAQAWFAQWMAPHTDTFAQTTMTVYVSVQSDLDPLNDTLRKTIVYGPPVGVGEDYAREAPKIAALEQNSPNPFSRTTAIRLALPCGASCPALNIYDASGRLVRAIPISMGKNEMSITWDGTREDGLPASSGIYFYTIQGGGFEKTRKMILLR